jgi:hypothetical protein
VLKVILLGDKNIKSDTLFNIKVIEDIKNTPSNSIVLFKYNLKLLKYCNENNIAFAVKIDNINELIYSNLLNARYIIVNKNLSKKAQKIADNYMYDSRIIVKIYSTNKLEWVAKNAIDGAILD